MRAATCLTGRPMRSQWGLTAIARSRGQAGAIDWQAANIGKMDAAHAADYARFRLQRQILDGMETGDAEGEALHTAVQTAERWAYKGLDGKTATEEIITARRADGKTYVVLSGDTDEAATDGTLFVLDPETGQPEKPAADGAAPIPSRPMSYGSHTAMRFR